MNLEIQGQIRPAMQSQRAGSSIWPSLMREVANRSCRSKKCRHTKIAVEHAADVSSARLWQGALTKMRAVVLPFYGERAFSLEDSVGSNQLRGVNFETEQVSEWPSHVESLSFTNTCLIRGTPDARRLSLVLGSGWIAETPLFSPLRDIRKTRRRNFAFCLLLRSCIAVN